MAKPTVVARVLEGDRLYSEVFDNKRTGPFKPRNKLERNPAQGNVPLVLLRVEADRHALLYIRIYVKATPTMDTACGDSLKVADLTRSRTADSMAKSGRLKW